MSIGRFSGTGVAMITPFNSDGSLNINELESHTDRLISKGVEYLVALGTTAETPTISVQEKLKIVEITKKVNNGRVPLIVGAGGNNTAEVIEWMNTLGSNGIDAYLSVAPYYNKPSQRGLKEHFSAIAAGSDLPIMLYNVPGRTGSNISAATTLELAHEFEDKIIAIKEASGDLSQIMHIIRDKPQAFQLVSGDDAIAPAIISLGGEGVVSVIGNALPDLFSDMIRDCLAGDFSAAAKKHYKILPFIELIFKEGNPTGVKALMEVLGIGACNLRLPLVPASKSLFEELKSLVNTL